MGKLLIHIITGVDNPSRAVLGFAVAKAALDDGHEVSVFCAGDGVTSLHEITINEMQGVGLGKLSDHLSALKEGKNQILDEKIGRSIHKIPKTSLMSYISKQNVPWTINTLDPETGITNLIIHTFNGSEDFAWTPSGIMFMGGGDILYKYDPNYDQDWVAMADLNNFGLNDITRLTVSPKGDKMVIVVVEKPVDK